MRTGSAHHLYPRVRKRLRHAATAVHGWLHHYFTVTSSGPGELVLTVTSTAWAVLLWMPTRSFVPGTSFSALVNTLGSELALAIVMTVLSISQWTGLIVDGWSPRIRATVTFVVALWWAFVAVEGALTRFVSPSWTLAAGMSWLAWLVWRAIAREYLRDKARAELHEERRQWRIRDGGG